MTRSIFSGSPSRLLVLVAGLVVACGDDGKTTAASESTANVTANATMTSTEGMSGTTADMTAGTTDEAPTTTAGTASASATATGSMTGATSDTGSSGGGFCGHQCSVDADCLAMGTNLGLTCEDSVCTGGTSAGCTSNEECVAVYSGWTMPCTAGGGECDAFMQVCIAAGDGGLCALPPSDFIMCESLEMTEIEVPDIDGNLVKVCAKTNAECNDDGICLVPCQSDADCGSDAYPVCDTNTGLCNCGSDDHCATLGQPNASVCNDGACGCNADQQCVDGKAGDTCTAEGFCGCSGDAACAEVPNPFDGGKIACVKP